MPVKTNDAGTSDDVGASDFSEERKMEEKSYSGAPQQTEEEKANWVKFETLAKQYREDASLRARIDAGDVSDTLEYLGVSIADGVKVRIVADTADRIHFPVPPPGRVGEMSVENLSAVVGGNTAGTAGCIGTAATFGCSCAPSTMSTAGTGGTIGSASSESGSRPDSVGLEA